MKKILAYFARRSHKVQVQVALATLHGLISIFGISKAVLIIVKLTKQHKGAHRAQIRPTV